MWEWIKKNHKAIITAIVSVVICFWLYACESQVKSLDGSNRLINRAELQLELDSFIYSAQLRMLSLDKQDALRAIVVENALIVMQGQPFNPVGLLTAVLGIYGTVHATSKVTRYAKNIKVTKKVNNGTT